METSDFLSPQEYAEVKRLISDLTGTENRLQRFFAGETDPIEKVAVSEFSNRQSAEYAIRRIAMTGLAWKAVDNEGTIIHRYQNHDESIPLYPSLGFVESDLKSEYPTVQSERIEYEFLQTNYLPRMKDEGLFLELLPQPNRKALLLDPSSVAVKLKELRGAEC